jgi:hypothetical protein
MTPDVVLAQAMTQSLMLTQASNSLNVSPRNRKPLRGLVPERVATVFTTGLEKGDFELTQRTLMNPSETPGVASLLLKRIASLVPQTLQLRTLVLKELDVDGDDLINLFETHQRNLQDVTLHDIVLTKAFECMVSLGHTAARRVLLEDVKVRDDSGDLQYLTAQSPVLLELLRLLKQRDPALSMLEYGRLSTGPIYSFSFRRKTWM